VRVDINGTQFTATLAAGPELRAMPDNTPKLLLRCVINGKPANPQARPKQIKVTVHYFGARAEELCRSHIRAGAWIGVEGRLDYGEWQTDFGARSELRVVARFITVLDASGNTVAEYEGSDPDAAPAPPANPQNAIPPPAAQPPPPAAQSGDALTDTVLAEFGISQR
jgi:single-stranded DNA-binding protein